MFLRLDSLLLMSLDPSSSIDLRLKGLAISQLYHGVYLYLVHLYGGELQLGHFSNPQALGI